MPDATSWLPIDAAPKDGTDILLTNGAVVSEGHWLHAEPYIRERRDLDGRYIDQDESEGYDGWIDWHGGMRPEPIAWMPLPPAPGAPPSPACDGVSAEPADRQKMAQRAHQLRREACGAWSACMKGGNFDEAAADHARAAEAELRKAIDWLAATPPAPPVGGADREDAERWRIVGDYGNDFGVLRLDVNGRWVHVTLAEIDAARAARSPASTGEGA